MIRYLHSSQLIGIALLSLVLAYPAAAKNEDTYDQDSILKDATDFFGNTTEGPAHHWASTSVATPPKFLSWSITCLQ